MAIQWNDVRANFNDANSAMGNAQKGLSQAGTVFGELRKSILDEEQRAVENDYRQKVFDENVRQFGLQYGLDQDKLAEQIRAAQAGEAHDAAVLKAQIESGNADRALRAQEIAAQRAYNMGRLGLEQQEFKHRMDSYKKEMAARQAGIDAVTKAEEVNKQVTFLNTQIKDVDNKIESVNTMPDLQFKLIYGKDATKDSVIKQLTDQKTNLNNQLSSFGEQALLATSASGRAKIFEDTYLKKGGDGSYVGPNWLNTQAGYEREDTKTKKALAAKTAENNREYDTNIYKKLKDAYPDINVNDLASAMSIYNDLRKNKELSGPEAFNMIVSNVKEKGRFGQLAAYILNNSSYDYDDISDVIKMLERGEALYPSSSKNITTNNPLNNITKYGWGKTKPIDLLNPTTGTQALEYMLGQSDFTLPSNLRDSINDLNRFSLFWKNVK